MFPLEIARLSAGFHLEKVRVKVRDEASGEPVSWLRPWLHSPYESASKRTLCSGGNGCGTADRP